MIMITIVRTESQSSSEAYWARRRRPQPQPRLLEGEQPPPLPTAQDKASLRRTLEEIRKKGEEEEMEAGEERKEEKGEGKGIVTRTSPPEKKETMVEDDIARMKRSGI